MSEKSKSPEIKLDINTPGEHSILFGEAEKKIYLKPLNITGVLSAPADFLKGKISLFKKEMAHLIIDRDNNKMTLNLDERSEKSPVTITGQLKPSEDLAAWNINTSTRWSVAGLLAFVRERKFFFADPQIHAKLISSLQKWNVNVEVIIKQHNDNSGNSLAQLERKVGEIDLVKEFALSIPIYKGYPKKTFVVNIGLDPKNTQVDFFLYSDELFFLTRSDREQLFNQEIENFKTLGFDCSVVEVS
jgi:hypothetical protein